MRSIKMNFSACSIAKSADFSNEAGFSLLEMMLVITISSLLAAVFLQLLVDIYQQNDFFSLNNAWQLDAYLAVDFIADQIKSSKKVEIIDQHQLDIFSYYNEEYQWLKFNVYQSNGNKNLGRSIGGSDLNYKDFGRNLSLFDGIDDLSFEIVKPGLLKISLTVKEKMKSGIKKLTVSRLIKI